MKSILIRDTTIISLLVSVVVFLTYQAPSIQSKLDSLGLLSSVVIPSAVFVIFFNTILWFYRNVLWQALHKQNSFNGSWIYALKNSKTNQTLYGCFELKHTWDDISIPVGKAWYSEDEPSDNNRRGTWSSSHISYSAEKLWIIFEMMNGPAADVKGETDKIYKGVIELTVEGDSPERLEGIYRDLDARSDNHGSISCVKSPKKIKLNELGKLIHECF